MLNAEIRKKLVPMNVPRNYGTDLKKQSDCVKRSVSRDWNENVQTNVNKMCKTKVMKVSQVKEKYK